MDQYVMGEYLEEEDLNDLEFHLNAAFSQTLPNDKSPVHATEVLLSYLYIFERIMYNCQQWYLFMHDANLYEDL